MRHPLSMLNFYTSCAIISIFSILVVQALDQPRIDATAFESSVQIPKLQYQFPKGQGGDAKRLREVKDVIKKTWDLYVQQARGFDETRPVTGGGANPL